MIIDQVQGEKVDVSRQAIVASLMPGRERRLMEVGQ